MYWYEYIEYFFNHINNISCLYNEIACNLYSSFINVQHHIAYEMNLFFSTFNKRKFWWNIPGYIITFISDILIVLRYQNIYLISDNSNEIIINSNT